MLTVGLPLLRRSCHQLGEDGHHERIIARPRIRCPFLPLQVERDRGCSVPGNRWAHPPASLPAAFLRPAVQGSLFGSLFHFWRAEGGQCSRTMGRAGIGEDWDRMGDELASKGNARFLSSPPHLCAFTPDISQTLPRLSVLHSLFQSVSFGPPSTLCLPPHRQVIHSFRQ